MAPLAMGASMSAVATAVAERPDPALPPAFEPHVRLVREDELPYVIHSWCEGYKNSPSCRRKLWPDYKAIDVPVLRAALARPDTTVLCAEADKPGRAVGWIAYARWPSIDAVHWIYVAHQYRRARSRGLAPIGVMMALLAAAGLRKRIVYTHQAATHHHHTRLRTPADQRIAELLRADGAAVSYVPYQEWSK